MADQKQDETSKNTSTNSTKETKKSAFTKAAIIENVKSIGFAIFLVLIIRSSIIEAFKIPSGSMIPTLLVGDHIFVNKFAYGLKIPFSDLVTDSPLYLIPRDPPKRGDIIVFTYPENESIYFIKRVIGIPGDRIAVREKTIYINDEPLTLKDFNHPEIINKLDDREFVKEAMHLYEETMPDTGVKHMVLLDENAHLLSHFGEQVVPAGNLFVMGDNRDYSSDSRKWGFVPFKNIRGKALFIWFSLWLDFDKEQYYFNPSRIGTGLK